MSSETLNEEAVDIEEVIALANRLSPINKVKLMEHLLGDIKSNLQEHKAKPHVSSYGILAHLGPGPSAEEIDEARKEMYTKLDQEEYL